MFRLNAIVFLSFFSYFSLSANPFAWVTNFYDAPVKFTGAAQHGGYSHPLVFADGRLLVIWTERSNNAYETVYAALSTDGGNSWGSKKQIASLLMNPVSDYLYVTAACSPAGNTVVAFSASTVQQPRKIFVFSSFGDLSQWNEVSISPAIKGLRPQLSVTRSGKFWLTYTTGYREIAALRSNDGTGWEFPLIISPPASSQTDCSITNFDSEAFIAAYNKPQGNTGIAQIFARKSFDNGTTWGDEFLLYQDTTQKSGSRILQSSDGRLHLIFSAERKTLRGVQQKEIVYCYSDNLGSTWNKTFLTNNYGGDVNPSSTQLIYNNPLISFSSVRGSGNTSADLYLAVAGVTNDNKYTAAFVSGYAQQRNYYSAGATVQTDDIYVVEHVKMEYRIGSGPVIIIDMYDDGLHDDGSAGDLRYGVRFPLPPDADTVFSRFIVKGAGQEIVYSPYSYFTPVRFNPSAAAMLDENEMKIPFAKGGLIAEYNGVSGLYKDEVFLFSSGFYLSGYAPGNDLFGNGVFSAARVQDYNPGLVDTDPQLAVNRMYAVNAGDTPFGESWQNWADAVQQGAPFYDGNGNNIYDPVDINGNGIWDAGEDKPIIAGNRLLWTVYNDNAPDSLRRFGDIPRKLEVRQTAFAFRNADYSLDHTIFLKYTISNKSTVRYDSLLFSFASDPDIGNYQDDYSGVSLDDKMAYAYNATPDAVYGNKVPSFGIKLLQGPAQYIPGITFTDVNQNGIFDDGDIPLTTAAIKSADFKSDVLLPGARQADFYSSTVTFKSHPMLGDPNTKQELRNRQTGRTNQGSMIDPCSMGNGSTLANCSQLDPLFLFSGDPETSNGWLLNYGLDVRFWTTTGPFSLAPGESRDVIGAYIISEGSSPLNAVTRLKQRAADVQQAFDAYLPVLVGTKDAALLPQKFVLHDNYPNPFNPATSIRFELPTASQITVKVYDILGNEVAVAADGYFQPGIHTIQFSGERLASGVYICRLTSPTGISLTKKMSLLK